MARESDGLDMAMTIRPQQLRPQHDAAPGDRVDDQSLGLIEWAGLPVNLDLAFSREQRDKVYVQHVIRKREAQLWRWSQETLHADTR